LTAVAEETLGSHLQVLFVRAGYDGPVVSFEPCGQPFEELERRSAGDEPTGVFPLIRDSMLRLVEVDCVLIRPA
jgi:hypothetical protein